MAVPTAGALAQARRRIGAAPLRALFDLLRGPAAGVSVAGVRWRGLLVTAIDGTILGCPDTLANLAVYSRGGGYQGGTGYPLVRVLALVTCGTRTIIDAVFGTDRTGETSYAHNLLPALRRGMIVLAAATSPPTTYSSPSPTPALTCWFASRSDATSRPVASWAITATSPGSASSRSASSRPESPW